MSLEQKIRQKRIITRVPSRRVLEQIEGGSKFVVVENDFNESQVPNGYTMISMRFRDETLKTLVPQRLLFYIANPGENEADAALDEIADFYENVKDSEDEMIEDGETSVATTNWATSARDSYRTYLINKLVVGDGEDGRVEFDSEVIKQLDLDDPEVVGRLKIMAGLVLDKRPEEIEKYDINSVIRHYSKGLSREGDKHKISRDEFYKITRKRFVSHADPHTKTMRCLSDSHYDLLPEFINDKEWDFDLRTMEKTAKKPSWSAEIGQVENDIKDYRAKKHKGEVGRHDDALIRMYANLAYIARENPGKQLDVNPLANGEGVK